MTKRPKDLLADKLAAGTAVRTSQVAGWWPAHASDLSGCLFHAWHVVDRNALVRVARTRGVAWDGFVSDPHQLMTQHVEIEAALIESVLRRDADAFRRFSKTLELNLLDQVSFHQKRTLMFPIYTLQDLLYSHVGLFTAALDQLTSRPSRRPSKYNERLSQNAVRLGALLTEWL